MNSIEDLPVDGPLTRETPATDKRSLAELEAEITELAGHLNAAHYRWLMLIAEFDQRHGWRDGALHSCAHWLNFKCGLDLGAAREKVRVAHALPGLPKIAAAMARGSLSYSKVRALTRVAEPATEDYFLSIALHGTACHVERLVRLYRRAAAVEELSREAAQQAARELHCWYDADGSVVVRGRLPALMGAMLMKALAAAADQTLPEAGAAVARTPAADRADALGVLAESFLEHGAARLRTADRHQVVVHVDLGTLRAGEPGRAEIEHGPALPLETVQRLTCDASLVALSEDARGEPVAVGRRSRAIAPALRRALAARDAGCRFPGCTHRRYVDAHHVRHWAHGGATTLANLVTLCRRHHRLVHEGGMTVQRLDDGALRFVRPDGLDLPSVPPSVDYHFDGGELRRAHLDAELTIGADTALTGWCGEAMDYGLAVEVLLQQARREAPDVSAETSGSAETTG